MQMRFLNALICTFLGLSLIACGSATPTPAPTPVPITGQPTAPPPSASATIAAPTTAPGTQPAATPTKFAIAVPQPTLTSAKPTTVPTSRPATPTGRMAYTVATGREPKLQTIWIANANGTNARPILTHGLWPALSPDGSKIAFFGRFEGRSEGLYLANSDGGNPVLIVIDPGVCCIDWSHNGEWIIYTRSPKANQPGGPISMIKIDGAYKTIVSLGVVGNSPTFSPDDKQIVYAGCLPNTSNCGLIIVPAGGGAPRLLTSDNGGNADWGTRGIVYQAADSGGHLQIFSINPDGTGKKQLTTGKSNDGQPVWSRDGGTIFWRSDQNGTAWAIYAMNFDGSNQRKLIDSVPPHPDLWGWESITTGP